MLLLNSSKIKLNGRSLKCNLDSTNNNIIINKSLFDSNLLLNNKLYK